MNGSADDAHAARAAPQGKRAYHSHAYAPRPKRNTKPKPSPPLLSIPEVLPSKKAAKASRSCCGIGLAPPGPTPKCDSQVAYGPVIHAPRLDDAFKVDFEEIEGCDEGEASGKQASSKSQQQNLVAQAKQNNTKPSTPPPKHQKDVIIRPPTCRQRTPNNSTNKRHRIKF